jgi:BlaI family penicillinase repressor
MDVLHSRREASAAEVLERLPDPPSYSSVRALLRILEEKGHVKHREEGMRYVYAARMSADDASRSALKRVVSTFFQGSPSEAIAALLESEDAPLKKEELKRIREMISKASREGR